MGATRSTSAQSLSADTTQPSTSPSVRDLQDYVVANVPSSGILKMRMAGDKSTDVGALTSMAEESAKQKYSGSAYSKSPSGYLATSAKPAGSSVV